MLLEAPGGGGSAAPTAGLPLSGSKASVPEGPGGRVHLDSPGQPRLVGRPLLPAKLGPGGQQCWASLRRPRPGLSCADGPGPLCQVTRGSASGPGHTVPASGSPVSQAHVLSGESGGSFQASGDPARHLLPGPPGLSLTRSPSSEEAWLCRRWPWAGVKRAGRKLAPASHDHRREEPPSPPSLGPATSSWTW